MLCDIHCHVLTVLTLPQCDFHRYVFTALTLPQCDGPLGKKAIELRENVAQQTVTCDGTGQTGQVQWKYTTTTGVTTTLVTCSSPSSCRADFNPNFATGTRNSTSSTLTFVTQASRTGHGTWSVTCFLTPATQLTCQLDVVCESLSLSLSRDFDRSTGTCFRSDVLCIFTLHQCCICIKKICMCR